jgi:hypothetical protein
MRSRAAVTVLVAFLALTSAGRAQAVAPDVDWTEAYGDSGRNTGYWIEECSTFGYVVSGTWVGSDISDYDALLMRVDVDGDTLWTKTWGDTLDNIATCVRETSDGGFIAVGQTERVPGDYDAWFIRTDADGDTLWTSQFDFGDADIVYSVVEIPGGDFIACGFSNGVPPADSIDMLVMRVDDTGHGLWKLILEKPGNERALEMCRTLDGNVAVAGFGGTELFREDAMLIKVNAASGDTIWTRSYQDTTTRDIVSGMRETLDGGFILCGGKTDYDTEVREGFLIKTDLAGFAIWSERYGGAGDSQYISSVVATPDSGFALGARRDTSETGDYDFHFMRTNSTGDTLWTKTLYEPDYQVLICMTVTGDNCYVSCGEGRVLGASARTILIVKLGEDDARVIPAERNPAPVLLAIEGRSPFTGSVFVRYEVASPCRVKLGVFDVRGRHVATLADDTKDAGVYQVEWDCRNSAGERVTSGMYFVKCEMPGRSAVEKALIVR